MRRIIGIVSAVGAILLATLLGASLVIPTFVERQALRVIELEIERRIGVVLEGPLKSSVGVLLQRIQSRNAQAIERLPARISAVVQRMQNSSCARRSYVERALNGLADERIAELETFNERIERIIQTRYGEVVVALTREFRIFTGVNAALFGALGLVMLRVRRASAHLVPAALVLLAASALSTYLYVFQQDWVHTIVFGDYVGFGYAAYVGLTALLLADIAFLHGVVTTAVLNALAGAIGVAASLVPC